ncbi:hypothetical protein HanIR_Chr13g0658121 [Helianthus annuus]|nr:hypothetical protein HanIR_Chr13g0658121 [Helianthus annuus]
MWYKGMGVTVHVEEVDSSWRHRTEPVRKKQGSSQHADSRSSQCWWSMTVV